MAKIGWTCTILVILALGSIAQAQQYPTRPVRFILGFPAGGPTDAAGRIIAQALSPALGQTVIVDNRPGADGAIGAEVAARASPDGHTLLLGSGSNIAGVPAMRHKPPYDSIVDFVPVAFVGWSSLLLVVHPGVPAKTLGELIAHARANPGKLIVAAANPPTIFTMAQINTSARVEMLNVPYGWFAFFAPARTPAAIVERLEREINTILKRPEIQAQFEKIGLETGGPSRQELPAFVKDQIASWAAAARDAGIQRQ